MKKLLPIILTVLILSSLALPALAAGQDYDYVNDETGLLSQSTYDQLEALNATLEEQCGAQFIVVFVNYFDTYADEYAVSLFNRWQLPNRAMLLVASPKEGRGGITVGAEITNTFTEKDINSYLDKYFWDDFDAGKYDRAVTRLADKIGDWYEKQYGFSGSGSGSGSTIAAGIGLGGLVLGFLLRNIVIILFFALLIVFVIVSDRRRFRGYYSYMGMPMPRYRPWFIFSTMPYRRWRPTPPPRGPRGPRGPGGFGPGPGPRSGGSRPSSHRSPGPGRSGGSFGGRSGGGGGHFGGGGGHSGGSFGGRR